MLLTQGLPNRYQAAMITPGQIRAARALLGWKQTDMAKAAGVSEMTIKNVEREGADARMSTLMAIKQACNDAGVIFLEEGANREGGVGVRLK
jgi:DNA-binding XRE family transcriptional regulator